MKFELNPPFIAGLIAFILTIFKLVVGVFSGSVAVISSAIDSLFDCVISILNYFGYIKAKEQPNERFNFGYGKVEALLAMFEGIIIVLSGIYIFYLSFMKFILPVQDIKLDVALLVMMACVTVTAFLVYYLNLAVKKTNSLIIKADILHYKMDLYTNFAVIFALIIIKFTNLFIIDAIFGVAISCYIVYNASFLIKDSVYILLDGAIDIEHEKQIKQIILESGLIKDFHFLRSRKSSKNCFLTVHFVFEPSIALRDAHLASFEVERKIKERFNDLKWIIITHFDLEDDSDIEGDLE